MKICFLAITLMGASASLSLAQAPETPAPSQSPVAPEVVKGFSSYTQFQASHDSSSGWSTVANSSIHYDFNKIFGVELGVPFYLSHNGFDSNVIVRGNNNPPPVTTYGSLGDAYLSLNFSAPGSWIGYKATITGTAPTGDTSSGISTGRATFDLNNHFEHAFGFFTPLVEFGMGDSSALVNKRVRRPYTTLGPLSHFKAGGGFDFLKYFNFQMTGYENLPIGDQKVYSHLFVRRKNGSIIRLGADGKKHRFALVAVDTGQGILEDNGLTSVFSINVGKHVDLSATYNRSLRQSLDTVEFGIGYRFGKSSKPPVE
jgi:hypothetical protein